MLSNLDTHISNNKTEALILGAGKPNEGETPSALKKISKKKTVLNWQVSQLENYVDKISFIGGYKYDLLNKKKTRLNFIQNRSWKNNNSVGSLLKYKFSPKKNLLVSYSDVVYRSQTICRLIKKNKDIIIGLDSNWFNRYEGRSKKDIFEAELFVKKEKEFKLITFNKKSIFYEFVGLVKFSSNVINFIEENKKKIKRNWSIPNLIIFLQKNKFQIDFEDCRGDWAELNAPQDLANFILGTKAETLSRLKNMIKISKIYEQVSFTVGDWDSKKEECLKNISEKFLNKKLIIRSSAINEDSFNESNAGKYLSLLNISQSNKNILIKSIQKVINSYSLNHKYNQVLIQEMVSKLKISGVITSRTLNRGSPYRVINFDDQSKLTDTVTSGSSAETKTIFVLKKKKILKKKYFIFNKLIKAMEEIEEILNFDSLDIEFAITENNKIIILQVRPIVIDQTKNFDQDKEIEDLIKKEKLKFLKSTKKSKNIFSNMQDWNPAEIVGRNPRNLAIDIYRYIITDKIWAIQRKEFGYKYPKSSKLIQNFCGKPYVNCEKSFYSFIPNKLNKKISEKLMKFYLKKLSKNQELHDKVEFQIAFTCFEFDFFKRAEELKANNFSRDEINQIFDNVLLITQEGISSIDKYFEQINTFEKKLKEIESSKENEITKAFLILQHCKWNGALPFAHLARNGFIAVTLLESAVRCKILTVNEKNEFLLSINTVAKGFRKDLESFENNTLTKKKFLNKYGHLRPGTYEITTPSYSESFSEIVKKTKEKKELKFVKHKWKDKTLKNLKETLSKSKLNLNLSEFLNYIKKSIEGRELSKFIFTKGVSSCLKYLSIVARKKKVDLELFSHLKLNDIKKLSKKENFKLIKKIAEKNQKKFNVSSFTELPPLLLTSKDFDFFVYPKNIPNFIGERKVRYQLFIIDNMKIKKELKNKIILIPNADPGFDWIFSHNISGLITIYGGANSHMAIRSAEFGISAAVGIGEIKFKELSKFKVVELDPSNKKLTGIY